MLVTQVQVFESLLHLAFEKGQDDLGEEPGVSELQVEVELVAEELESHLALLLLRVGPPFEDFGAHVSVGGLVTCAALLLSDELENGLNTFQVAHYLHLGAVDVLNQVLIASLSCQGQESAALCEGLLAI